jgi:tetratricopeptide (TPR) repeat protein
MNLISSKARCSLVLVLSGALGAALFAAPHARADAPAEAPVKRDAEAKTRAEKQFQRGITAYKEGRFKDAIDAFLDAHRQYPSPTLSFNAARAYEKMGDSAGALRFFREYLRQSPSASDRVTVEQEISDLEKKLEDRGVQQVTVLANVDGPTVIIDGRPVGVAPWTGEIVPGRHKVKLRFEGYSDALGEFELTPQRSLDVRLEIQPAPKAEPMPVATPAPPVNALPPRDHAESTGVSVWTWTAFGVGAAAFGGALAFELMRGSAESDVKNEPTQLARHDAYDRMQSRQTTARVLVGVGAVATVAGSVLLYLDLQKGGSSETRVGLGCSGAECGARVRGRF